MDPVRSHDFHECISQFRTLNSFAAYIVVIQGRCGSRATTLSRRSSANVKIRTCVERSLRYQRINDPTEDPRKVRESYTTTPDAIEAASKAHTTSVSLPSLCKKTDLRHRAHRRNATLVMASRLPRRTEHQCLVVRSATYRAPASDTTQTSEPIASSADRARGENLRANGE